MTSLPLALLWSMAVGPTDPVVYREGSWILIVPRHMADHIFQFAKLSTGYKFLKKGARFVERSLVNTSKIYLAAHPSTLFDAASRDLPRRCVVDCESGAGARRRARLA